MIANQRGSLRSVPIAISNSFAEPSFLGMGAPVGVVDMSRHVLVQHDFGSTMVDLYPHNSLEFASYLL